MFRDCSKLASVTMKATDVNAESCLSGWLIDAGKDATNPTLYVPSTMVENTNIKSAANKGTYFNVVAIP